MLSDELLKHVGVVGMKWGVRRDRGRSGGADGVEESVKVKDTRGKLSKKLSSMNRERQWKKVLNDVDKLSTKDITKVSKRISLENDMKRLSKSKIAKPKDKDDYLNREKMSDAELTRKVTRLRAKDSLLKTVNDASKEQREFGEKIVQIGGSVGVKYALNRGRIQPKDLFDVAVKAYKNPKETSDKAKQDLQKEILGKITNSNNS